MTRLDRIAITVIITAVIAIAAVIAVGGNVPVTATCLNCAQISPYGALDLEFSRAVEPQKIENLWRIDPIVPGRWTWLDDRHARWHSLVALPAARTVSAGFSSGSAGMNGERFREEIRWEMSVRQPLIMALTAADEVDAQLYLFDPATDEPPQPLTHSAGLILDYSPSPDGQQVAFSVINLTGGSDIWTVERDGSNERMLLECGTDRCTAPSWSPASAELAYTRETSGIDPQGARGAPRIHILNTISGATSPLFIDPQQIGYGANWSPDGVWIAIWDGINGGIKVTNRQTGAALLLQSDNGDTGSWSADSRTLFYTDIVAGEAGYHNLVLQAEIDAGEDATAAVSVYLGGNADGTGLSYNDPIANPVSDSLVVAAQANVSVPGKEVLIHREGASQPITVVNDISRIPAFFNWSPSGEELVFQMLPWGGSPEQTEVWIWDEAQGARRLASGFKTPNWLP